MSDCLLVTHSILIYRWAPHSLMVITQLKILPPYLPKKLRYPASHPPSFHSWLRKYWQVLSHSIANDFVWKDGPQNTLNTPSSQRLRKHKWEALQEIDTMRSGVLWHGKGEVKSNSLYSCLITTHATPPRTGLYWAKHAWYDEQLCACLPNHTVRVI